MNHEHVITRESLLEQSKPEKFNADTVKESMQQRCSPGPLDGDGRSAGFS
jgi:hypothetical protein